MAAAASVRGLDRHSPPAASRPDPWDDRMPDAFFWRARLSASGPLPVERAADVARAFVGALNQTARDLFGSNRLPPDLHAETGPLADEGPQGAIERHRHAFIVAEDLAGSGRLDHVSVILARQYGAAGFTRRGLTVLAACPGFWLEGVDARLETRWLGPAPPEARDGPARAWRSLTPFAPPVWKKAAPDQLARCIRRLGLPAPVLIAPAPPPARRPAAAYEPRGPALRAWNGPIASHRGRLAFWRMEFAEPVAGPLIVGGLAHLGLGRFAPGP